MKKIFTKFNAFKTSLPIYNLILGLILMSSFSAWGQSPEIFSMPGTTTWTCPAGVTSVTVECWGGGGAGGTATIATTTTSRSGGGGGGGSYVRNTFTVVPGQMYSITVGAGGTTNAIAAATSHGNSGGKSEFSGSGITTLTATGGTGGGGTSALKLTGTGGTLGGVYGYQITSAGSGYSSPTVAVDAPTSGTTATAVVGLSSGAVGFVTSNVQGTGYTTAPNVIVSGGGSGAIITALINPNINAGGTSDPGPPAGTVIGGNGGAATATQGGSGGGAGGAAAGGAGGRAANTTANSAGLAGLVPGGGGSGGYVMNNATTGRLGGLGGDGRVKLTYTVTPVELTFFKAKRNQSSNLLTWATASESNNAFFDIQRSTDGVDFQTIGQVKGNGTTAAESRYTFDDRDPSVSTNYYRLRQVDFDGSETLSNTVAVSSNGKKGQLSVYPTLATDKLNIVSDNTELTTYVIFNLLGQNVQSGQILGSKELIISLLPKGTYVLKVGDMAVKFIKN